MERDLVMTMLNIHAEALGQYSAYHEFLLHYKCKEKIVYGFVEGNDDSNFYRGLIENTIPNDWVIKLIYAGNKHKVLQAYKDFDWIRFPKNRVCFFVDRDLSDFLNDINFSDENLYITDMYSIENEVVNPETLERVLEEIFNIRGLSPEEIKKIRTIFENNLKRFSTAMLPIMSQIIIWKKSGNRPCLDNIQPIKFFRFSNGKVFLKTEYKTKMDLILSCARECKLSNSTSSEISNMTKKLQKAGNEKKFIRGKYLLDLFVECARNISNSITNFSEKFMKAPKMRISFGRENALTILGPRVRIPESLKNFIEINYLAYIQGATALEET